MFIRLAIGDEYELAIVQVVDEVEHGLSIVATGMPCCERSERQGNDLYESRARRARPRSSRHARLVDTFSLSVQTSPPVIVELI